MGGYFV